MNVVSFFAGCGGLDLGFEQAGFHVVWANDFDSRCCATYVRNHPKTEFVLADLNTICPNDVPDCDGFIGGPPCQSWSIAGKQRGLEDSRGKMFVKYIEMIEAKKPKFFVIENVKGMLDNKFKCVFDDFVHRLACAGYDVQWSLLDTANFRVPQNRERVFFVGFRKELGVTYLFPNPTCTEPITLEKAIGDINQIPNYCSGKKNNAKLNISGIPNHDVYSYDFGQFYYRSNRRRGWQQPSFTISATADYIPLHPASPKMMFYGQGSWKFQNDRFSEYRRLSVRECARIQTFPDSFIFECDDIKDAYRMIGNAVPPRLGYEIAKSILNALNGVIQPLTLQKPTVFASNIPVLVGYYKGDKHKQQILESEIYYVRSDNRPGSVFKEDCTIVPKFLLLHYKDEAEYYELDGEEPVLVDASFLKSIGFSVSGKSYLCFRLKRSRKINIGDPMYEKYSYAPVYTTLGETLNTL